MSVSQTSKILQVMTVFLDRYPNKCNSSVDKIYEGVAKFIRSFFARKGRLCMFVSYWIQFLSLRYLPIEQLRRVVLAICIPCGPLCPQFTDAQNLSTILFLEFFCMKNCDVTMRPLNQEHGDILNLFSRKF